MYVRLVTLAYIDPNTSQYVFSLLGPLLACLTAVGGLAIAVVVFIRHQLVSSFRNASWATRMLIVGIGVGTSALIAFVIWRIVR